MKAGHLETLDGVPRYIQYAVFPLIHTQRNHTAVEALFPPQSAAPSCSCCCAHLVGDFLDGLYAGSVQVVVVLPSLDELVLLDLSLHELSGGHEVVISAVHLVVSPRPRRV